MHPWIPSVPMWLCQVSLTYGFRSGELNTSVQFPAPGGLVFIMEGLGVPAQLSGSPSLAKAEPECGVKSLILQWLLLSCSLGLPLDRRWVEQNAISV